MGYSLPRTINAREEGAGALEGILFFGKLLGGSWGVFIQTWK
jgi:hypothetical protein